MMNIDDMNWNELLRRLNAASGRDLPTVSEAQSQYDLIPETRLTSDRIESLIHIVRQKVGFRNESSDCADHESDYRVADKCLSTSSSHQENVLARGDLQEELSIRREYMSSGLSGSHDDLSPDEEIMVWLEAEHGSEEAKNTFAGLNGGFCTEVSKHQNGSLEDFPAVDAIEGADAAPPSSEEDLKKKREFTRRVKRKVFEKGQRVWSTKKVAEEFTDKDGAWKALTQHLFTCQADGESQEDLGVRLQWMADRNKAFSVDQVKYRLQVVLETLCEAAGSVAKKHRRMIANAGGDPEKARENASRITMRWFRKALHDRTDRR